MHIFPIVRDKCVLISVRDNSVFTHDCWSLLSIFQAYLVMLTSLNLIACVINIAIPASFSFPFTWNIPTSNAFRYRGSCRFPHRRVPLFTVFIGCRFFALLQLYLISLRLLCHRFCGTLWLSSSIQKFHLCCFGSLCRLIFTSAVNNSRGVDFCCGCSRDYSTRPDPWEIRV